MHLITNGNVCYHSLNFVNNHLVTPMPQKTKQVGVRLTDQEAEFIAQLRIENAATPSDKLRAIIDDAMRRKLGTEDYDGSLKLVIDLLAPTTRIVRGSENKHHMHSELVSRMSDWVPECMAYLIASNGAETELDEQQLREIEASLADRVFVLIQSVLQLAITRRAPLYDPSVVQDSVEPVLELADVITRLRTPVNQ